VGSTTLPTEVDAPLEPHETHEPRESDLPAASALPPRRADFAFMRGHAAHWVALGFGSGLSPRAPGTVGTLWGWVSFLVLDRHLAAFGAAGWATVIVLALALGVWASTRTAQHLGLADPGSIVWDEIVAFWIVLWLVTPASFWVQVAAFALFRYFDAAKPGPVRWADGLFKQPSRAHPGIGWRQGVGILFDDLVAAGCTLVFIALWIRLWNS
jgi:phosphatidylglycerophosphatase A